MNNRFDTCLSGSPQARCFDIGRAGARGMVRDTEFGLEIGVKAGEHEGGRWRKRLAANSQGPSIARIAILIRAMRGAVSNKPRHWTMASPLAQAIRPQPNQVSFRRSESRLYGSPKGLDGARQHRFGRLRALPKQRKTCCFWSWERGYRLSYMPGGRASVTDLRVCGYRMKDSLND
jgi:hypothetical protein